MRTFRDPQDLVVPSSARLAAMTSAYPLRERFAEVKAARTPAQTGREGTDRLPWFKTSPRSTRSLYYRGEAWEQLSCVIRSIGAPLFV